MPFQDWFAFPTKAPETCLMTHSMTIPGGRSDTKLPDEARQYAIYEIFLVVKHQYAEVILDACMNGILTGRPV